MPPSDERDYYEHIYKVVNQIPRGMVATYGDVAAVVGDGCDGRIVGHALGALGPRSVQVAWQRVIGQNGQITTRNLHQPDKLAAEGVEFDERGYVLMDRFHWPGRVRSGLGLTAFSCSPRAARPRRPRTTSSASSELPGALSCSYRTPVRGMVRRHANSSYLRCSRRLRRRGADAR